MDIKDIIRERRLELGLTYEQLGKMVGVGKSTVRKWETGMIENMKRDNIIALAKALNVSPALIMGWDDDSEHNTKQEIYNNEKISEIINKIKKEKGMTSIELSKKSGVPLGTLNKILNGETKNPTFEVVSALAHALGCTVDTFDDAPNKLKQTTSIDIEEFNTPESAMKFILSQPAIAAYGGFDVNKMSDEEVIDFANELLHQLKLLGYKYKK